ncbi:MAG: right-handed parallel beta-helix repeat-containing protein, partial [Phycisphaeraceae bacterium]
IAPGQCGCGEIDTPGCDGASMDGWTVLTPAPDTRILYVSSSEGSDAGGYRYSTLDEVGGDAFNPLPGTYEPYETIQAAYDDLRDGKPDWVLLRRGDEWDFGSSRLWWTKDGPAADRRQVLSAYGPVQDPRPKLIFDSPGISLGNGSGHQRNLVFAHLHLYAANDGMGSQAHAGIGALIIDDAVSEIANILIEGVLFDSGHNAPLIMQNQSGSGKIVNVIVRRSVIYNTYRSAAYFTGYSDVLLEECVFVETGLRWSFDNPSGGLDQQCLYLQDGSPQNIDNVRVVRSIFVDLSSTAIQARSGGRVNENLFVRCPMAIAPLGNDGYESDGLDAGEAIDNVILQANDMPAGRGNRGWGIGIQNLDGGLVSGNIIASLEGRHPSGIGVSASQPNQTEPGSVQILENVIYNHGWDALVFQDNGGLMSAHVDGNTFYDDVTELPSEAGWLDLLVRSRESDEANNENYSFGANHYYGNANLWPESSWFDGWDGVVDLASWLAYSGDGGGLSASDPWQRDTEVTIEAFLESGLVSPMSYEDWRAALAEQRLGAWDASLEAKVAINWFRVGFGKEELPE